jgi:hypothetical protein
MNNLHGLFWLTLILLRRLAREGMVVRSLIFPTTLVIGTLLATLVVMAAIRSPRTVAIAPDDPAVQMLEDYGFTPVLTSNPKQAVRSGDAWAGVIDDTLVTADVNPELSLLESGVRSVRGSSWRPAPVIFRPSNVDTQPSARRIANILAVLFTLYGTVFGAGMLARDREDGTLESELSLPIARWVPPTARFLGGSIALGAFFAGGVFLVDAVLDVAFPAVVIGHGIAASACATAIGLAAAANSTLKSGFSTTLAFSMTGISVLGSVGVASPGLRFLPIASLSSHGSPVTPLFLAAAAGVLASAWFAWRAR